MHFDPSPPRVHAGLLAVLGVLGCSNPAPDTPGDTVTADDTSAGAPRSVLVLTLDGVRAAELSSPEVSPLAGMTGEQCAPGLWTQLASKGRYVRRTYNITETFTVGAHASLLEGRFERLSTVNLDRTGPANYRPLYPTIFEELRTQQAVAATDVFLVANNQILPGLTASVGNEASGATWVHVPEISDTAVTDAILRIVDDHAPRLLVANLHDSDRAGHAGAAYLDRIRTQDASLVDLLGRLETEHPQWWANALIVVTTDHGRHLSDDPEGWREHGDSCGGCRELPLFLFGGAIEAGVEPDGGAPIADIDVAATMAAHLGIELPWSHGRSLARLVRTVDDQGPRGAVEVEAVGNDTVYQRFRNDDAHRSEIVLRDEVVSSPTAWAAEAPVVASSDTHDALCWREIDLAHPTAAGAASIHAWTPHCRVRRRGEPWTDIGFATPAVVAGFEPALTWNGDRLDVAWYASPIDASSPTQEAMGLSIASWTPDGTPRGQWQAPASLAADTTNGLLAATTVRPRGSTNAETILARAGALEPTAAAVSRGVEVINFAVRSSANVRFDELWRTHPRVEHPSLLAQGDMLWLAVIGMEDGGRGVALSQSTDAGRTWSPPQRVVGDPPLVHLAPRWSQSELVYAGRAADGTASVCRAPPGGAARCTSTGFARLDSFALQGNRVLVSVDTGVGNWEIRTLGE